MRGIRCSILSPLLESWATARAMQTGVQSQPLLLSNCVILNVFLDLSLGYLICKMNEVGNCSVGRDLALCEILL